MHLNTSARILFAISSFLPLAASLPFLHRERAVPRALVKRATYSVVAVDGGAAATSNSEPTVIETIVQTVTATPSPATKTVVQTESVTLPQVTDYIVSTQTIEGAKTTQTIVITASPSISIETFATTKYSVIDVSAAPTTVEVTVSTLSTATTKSSVASTTQLDSSPSSTPISASASANTPVIVPSSTSAVITATSPTNSTPSSTSLLAAGETSITSSLLYTSVFTTPSTTLAWSSSTTIVVSLTPTYDNGQWHTYYPSWSNATGTITTPTNPVNTLLPTSAVETTTTINGREATSSWIGLVRSLFERSP